MANRASARVRSAVVLRVAMAAKPYALGWGMLAFYLVLVLATDGTVWYLAERIGDLTWVQMVLYSVFSYPLWMLIGTKGVVREQTDLIEQGRWHAVDLLPGGPTMVMLGHHLGKTFKTRALWAWAAAFAVAALERGATVWALALASAGIALGTVNLLLAGVLTRLYAPKGYAGVCGAILYSATAILSGSAFPLQLVGDTPLFRLVNPFATTVSGPLSLLLDGHATSGVAQLQELGAATLWTGALLAIALRAERTQRARIHS